MYYNTRENALFAILYHTAANTIGGFYFFPMCSQAPDSVRLWWLYAAVYCVAAVVVVLAPERR